MRISIKFTIPVIIFLAISTALTVILTDTAVKKIIRSQENTAEKQMISEARKTAKFAVAAVYQNIQSVADKSLSQATLFTAQPGIIEQYQLAQNGNMDDEKDQTVQNARIKLREYIRPIYNKYLADSGRSEFHLHFHLPNNRSFLRTWRDRQTKEMAKKSIYPMISLLFAIQLSKSIKSINRSRG